MTVAGVEVHDPLKTLDRYAKQHEKTVRRYDHADRGDPHVLTTEEVGHTRVFGSRISAADAAWMVERAGQHPRLWRAVPHDAHLAAADPAEPGGLYDAARELFDVFMDPPRRGVRWGKVSKVLHLKRPALFPILDSGLRARYRRQAVGAAPRHAAAGRAPVARAYWIAVRDDLLDPRNVEGLARLRGELAAHHDEVVRLLADLSDVRLLDILAWEGQE